MIQIMRECAFRPEHYNLYDKNHITANHVAHFFGCQLVRVLRGLLSVKDCWSTRDFFNAIGIPKESMLRGAFLDMQWCMHFANDCKEKEGEVWGKNFVNEKLELPISATHHWREYAIIEDAFNEQWKAAVIFGQQLMMDKSCTPGWYKGPITQGSEPKPACMGAMMHTVCMTDGPLTRYKIYAWMFGGKTNKDL